MSFCIRLPFNPWLQIHLCCPLFILPNSSTPLILAVTEIVLAATGAPIATSTTTNTGLIFMVLIPLLPRTRSRVIGSRPNGLLVLDNGFLTGYLSTTSSVSHASSSATQPYNMLSFAAAVISLLPILLLVLFLPLLGSQKLVWTNMLRLILRLWPILHPILVMITCMLVTVRVFPYH